MSRKVLIILMAVGFAVFAYLVHRIGVDELVANARMTGWMIVPIVLVHAFVNLGTALAWYIIMADEPSRPPFLKTYGITISGFALNYVTPIVNLGGEPFKIAAAAPWLGVKRATGSVLIFTMLHALSHILLWLSAVMLTLIFVPNSATGAAALAALGVLLAGLVAFLFARHRNGIAEPALDLLQQLPLLNRLGRKLEPRRELLASVDRQITAFYHTNPGRFFATLAILYISRCTGVLEYHLIFQSLDLGVSYLTSFLITNFSSLILNALFFIPFELGSKEGGMFLLFQWMGLPAELGVYSAIVSRLREIIWIGFGLALTWVAGRR